MAKEGFVARTILATVDGCKSVSDGFTRSLDTYKTKHDKSEKDDGWVGDFPKNVWDSMDDLVRGVAKAPGIAVDRFLEDDDKK